MTLGRAIDIFLILQDKYGSPNVIESEVVDYLNMSTNEYLNRLFPDNEGSVVNFEFDQNIVMNIQPLIWTLSGLNMNSSGILTNAAINTALQSATSDSSAEFFRIGAVALASGVPVKYVKQNNRWAYEQNFFKKPSLSRPKYSPVASGLQFYPTSETTGLIVNVIKAPRVLNVSDSSSEMEFSDYSVYNIIAIALKLAFVATRDIEGVEVDARIADLQISK